VAHKGGSDRAAEKQALCSENTGILLHVGDWNEVKIQIFEYMK
jgi:hypothetical protein